MNKVFLIGRLTRDPELSTVGSGVEVCKFSLAVNRTYKDASGEYPTDFLNIVVWRAAAVNCHKYLKKGNQCAVLGSIQTRTYDDKDGNKRYATDIVADNVEFLGKPTGSGDSSFNEFDQDTESTGNKKVAIDTLKPVEDEDLPF